MRCTFCEGSGRMASSIYGSLSFHPQIPCRYCGGTGILRPLTSSEQRILDGALRRSVKIVENGNEPD